jgi:hypothetical protein
MSRLNSDYTRYGPLPPRITRAVHLSSITSLLQRQVITQTAYR